MKNNNSKKKIIPKIFRTETNLIEVSQKKNQHILKKIIIKYITELKEVNLLPKEILTKINEVNELLDTYLSKGSLLFEKTKNVVISGNIQQVAAFNIGRLL